jgi:hypothetical protein
LKKLRPAIFGVMINAWRWTTITEDAISAGRAAASGSSGPRLEPPYDTQVDRSERPTPDLVWCCGGLRG